MQITSITANNTTNDYPSVYPLYGTGTDDDTVEATDLSFAVVGTTYTLNRTVSLSQYTPSNNFSMVIDLSDEIAAVEALNPGIQTPVISGVVDNTSPAITELTFNDVLNTITITQNTSFTSPLTLNTISLDVTITDGITPVTYTIEIDFEVLGGLYDSLNTCNTVYTVDGTGHSNIYTQNTDLDYNNMGTKEIYINSSLWDTIPEEAAYETDTCNMLTGTDANTVQTIWHYTQQAVYNILPTGCGCGNVTELIIPETVLLEVINPSQTFTVNTYKPYFQIGYVSEQSCVGCNQDISEDATLTFSVVEGSIIPNSPDNNLTLTYYVLDDEGELINSWSYEDESGVTDFSEAIDFDSSSYSIEDLDKKVNNLSQGTYTVYAKLENECCYWESNRIVITVADELKITSNCGLYTVSNCSSTKEFLVRIFDHTFDQYTVTESDCVLYERDSEDNLVAVSSPTSSINLPTGVNLEPGMCMRLSLPLGVYIVEIREEVTDITDWDTTIDYPNIISYNVITNHCAIESCFLEMIENIRCNENEECDNLVQERYNTMIFFTEWFTYLSYIQNYLDYKNTYSSLDNVQPAITKAGDILDKLEGFCDCTSYEADNGDLNDTTDCGCTS